MPVYLKDLAERVFWTFVQAFLGALVVTDLTDRGMWLAAGAAGVAASASLVKGFVARYRGLEDSASLAKDV